MSSVSNTYRPLASVIYLGIAGLSGKPVAEQARLRAQLDAAVSAASKPMPEADRLVLDAPDGAAIVVLGDARGALQAAERAEAAGRGAFAIGINHGPVSLTAEHGNDARLIGDGIDAAISVAGFATAERLLLSRPFRDALAEVAPQLAAAFHRAGTYTDARVRSHEVFSRDEAARRRDRRRRIAVTALIAAALIALGFAARVALQSLIEARQPATLVFDVRPQGEIYLDGVLRGKAPALSRLQVPPGSHRVEIRNGRFPPHVSEIDARPGEQLVVKHSFIAPAAPKPRGLADRLRFWQ